MVKKEFRRRCALEIHNRSGLAFQVELRSIYTKNCLGGSTGCSLLGSFLACFAGHCPFLEYDDELRLPLWPYSAPLSGSYGTQTRGENHHRLPCNWAAIP